jgi:hypothetical protein
MPKVTENKLEEPKSARVERSAMPHINRQRDRDTLRRNRSLDGLGRHAKLRWANCKDIVRIRSEFDPEAPGAIGRHASSENGTVNFHQYDINRSSKGSRATGDVSAWRIGARHLHRSSAHLRGRRLFERTYTHRGNSGQRGHKDQRSDHAIGIPLNQAANQ